MTKSSLFNPMNLIINENLQCSSLLETHKTSGTQESYFLKTLNFLTESRKEFNEVNKNFYKAILESQSNQIVVHESFSDFFDAIKKIIDKVIEFIKSLFNKFITALNMAIKSDRYLINNKDDFKKFGANHEFKFSGYEFTFTAGVPSLSVLESFASSMNDIQVAALNKEEAPAKTVSKVKEKYDALVESLSDQWYDQARARTLCKPEKDTIGQTEYANELFLLFRGEASSKEEIDVTSTVVTLTYSRFEGSKKLETEIGRDKTRIEREYTDIKKQIETAVKRTANGTLITIDSGSEPTNLTMHKDVLGILDLFIKAKANQIQELSNIHALAFAAKLDAIGDSYKQDKSLLYQALYKVQGMNKEVK